MGASKRRLTVNKIDSFQKQTRTPSVVLFIFPHVQFLLFLSFWNPESLEREVVMGKIQKSMKMALTN